MTAYKILSANDPNILRNDVEHHLAKGWQLQGGVAIAWLGVNFAPFYLQAVIKGAGKWQPSS